MEANGAGCASESEVGGLNGSIPADNVEGRSEMMDTENAPEGTPASNSHHKPPQTESSAALEASPEITPVQAQTAGKIPIAEGVEVVAAKKGESASKDDSTPAESQKAGPPTSLADIELVDGKMSNMHLAYLLSQICNKESISQIVDKCLSVDNAAFQPVYQTASRKKWERTMLLVECRPQGVEDAKGLFAWLVKVSVFPLWTDVCGS